MSKKVLVVAPHPDDETLGCGATLLKHIADGDEVHWLIMTAMSQASGYSEEQILKREQEISAVTKAYGFRSCQNLSFKPANLDLESMSNLVGTVSPYIQQLKPEIIYLPYRGDVHNDHQITFDAVVSSTKAFRAPFVKRILSYETLSETDFNLNPDARGFTPNVWVDVSTYLSKKLEIVSYYESELAEFPFPRSIKAIEALASIRGVQCVAEAAEAFMLIKEVSR